MFLQTLLHGIARMFTLPATVRRTINANPIVAQEKPVVEGYVLDAIAKTLEINVSDPVAAEAANVAIGHAIAMTGVFH